MQIISKSVNQTLKIGRLIAKNLTAGDIVCLIGDLGTGKTVLTKGIAQGLGIKKNEITSPTFVLIHQYNNTHLPFYHFDLYRLKSPKDILDLGYQEYFYSQGITVIEWADRLKYLKPCEFLKINLLVKNENSRLLKFEAEGRHYKELLRKIHENIRH